MNGAYYNEHDKFAAAWLRELIKAGLIADGEVDERNIQDVRASDLRGFVQCHFFAGIGGWSYALRLAGWPDDRPVWTGSCPCQPFSAAGKRKGVADDRHLWPHWARLIGKCQPVAVFGEQVESAIAHGWLDAVFDDLEREGYACGAACLPAGSVGAPHIRQRLWFVAESGRERRQQIARGASGDEGSHGRESDSDYVIAGDGENGRLAESEHAKRRSHGRGDERDGQDTGRAQAHGQSGACREVRELGHRLGTGLEGRHERRDSANQCAAGASSVASFWADCESLPCRDGKWRPVEPGLFPLAHGVSGRVGRLRGYGNAIVPQVAAAFIEAYLEIA